MQVMGARPAEEEGGGMVGAVAAQDQPAEGTAQEEGRAEAEGRCGCDTGVST